MICNCHVTMIVHFVKRLMCEVVFFLGGFEEGTLPFLHGANSHTPASNIQIVDLERSNCQSTFNLFGHFRIHQSKVRASSHCNDFPVNPGVVEQMLLYRYSTLFLVERCSSFTPSEFNI